MQVLHGEWSSASGRQDWNTDQKCFLYLQKKTTKYGRGLSAELTMDDLFYVRWQAILAHLGLEADGVEMEKEFRRLLHLTAIPVEGAEELLEYLHKKDYCLCAASNGPYEQQINRLKSADMLKYFDHCFVSEKIGADKPGKTVFDGCMRILPGVQPEECMMIGDSLTADIAGGKLYGMSTCWYVPSVEKI